MPSEMRRDPERIYLEPWPYSPEGRLWNEENVWPLYTWPPEPGGESERATGVEYIRADLHDAEIARLTREMEAARERERHRERQRDAAEERRALATDMEGGEAEPPAHPVRMAQPDEEMAL